MPLLVLRQLELCSNGSCRCGVLGALGAVCAHQEGGSTLRAMSTAEVRWRLVSAPAHGSLI